MTSTGCARRSGTGMAGRLPTSTSGATTPRAPRPTGSRSSSSWGGGIPDTWSARWPGVRCCLGSAEHSGSCARSGWPPASYRGFTPLRRPGAPRSLMPWTAVQCIPTRSSRTRSLNRSRSGIRPTGIKCWRRSAEVGDRVRARPMRKSSMRSSCCRRPRGFLPSRPAARH